MEKLYKMGSSPHIRTNVNVKNIMYDVIIALVPAIIMSIYFFGIRSLFIIALSVLTCIGTEYGCNKYMKKEESHLDGSAVITGILFAFLLPSSISYLLVILGSFISIFIGKVIFGGLGHNIFNPAILGRIFLMISYPVDMTNWPLAKLTEGVSKISTDGVTGATVLALLKKGESLTDIMNNPIFDLLIGKKGGSLGETSVLALLLGGIFLIYKKHIDYKVPLTIFGLVFLICLGVGVNPLYHVLSGGLVLGAFFMATDMVTTPYSSKGKIIFAIGVAAITMLIRIKGSYPEGVAFSILIMNGITPLINKYIKPKRFSEVK
ncbi:MAG: RnfABCDGE type electron transport complex subunit D [Fusobacteriaceae bacterium]|nr:RnfABCDGE type electron transport complex subunit D [Fusobacteriaceae bacterium]MBN2839247.1 RnfABCDGE type electron transport complex subunit D [Fusobacteriaceae bacterium]